MENIKDVLHFTEKEKDEVLERFMKEHIPFNALLKVGFFTKEMRKDYKAQAERVCRRLGLKSIYEYRAKEISCHITYAGERPPNEPFVTVIPSIYD